MNRRFLCFSIALATLLPALPTLNAAQIPGGFTQINMEDGGYLTGLIQHGSGRLVCRTDGGGIYSSDNGGFAWNYLSGNMYSYASMCVAGFAVPQTTNSSSNLILQVTGADWLLTDPNRGIWKTTDGGASWTHTLTGVNFWGDGNERMGGEPVIFHPTNDLEAWAGSHAQGLYQSMNSGSTWTLNSGFPTSNVVTSISISPLYPDQIFVAVEGGLSVSTNHGTNWSQIMSTPGAIYRVTRGPDGTVYYGGQNGSSHVLQKITSTNWTNTASYVITDLSSAYNKAAISDGDPLTCVTVLRNGWLLAADYGNCLLSTNAGTNFTALPNSYVAGTVVPQWGTSAKVDRPDCLVEDVTATNTWYGGGGNAPLRTDDGGQHWQFIFNGIGEVVTMKVAFNPVDPNRLYIPCADNGGGVVTDGGISGNTVSMVKGYFYNTDGLMFANRALPSQSNGINRVIFVGGDEFNNEARLYITTNDGATWYVPPMTGLPTTAKQVLVDAVDSMDAPDDFLVVVGGNSGSNMGGVYRTTNGGTNFTQCNWYPANSVGLGGSGSWNVHLDRDATNLNVRYLYATAAWPAIPPATNTGGGFFVSTNRGVTWTQTTGGAGAIISSPVHDWNDFEGVIAADHGSSGHIWAALQTPTNVPGYGVGYSSNYGSTFSAVTAFTNAYAVDALSNNVVVYGQMSGDTFPKIYYSTNNGTNWGLVTTTNYEFGNALEVSLDPHRAGRIFISTQERSVGIFTPGTPEQQWQLEYFGSANSSQGANGANPNSNGVPNLVEYALGADPLAGTSGDPLGYGSTNGTNFLPYAMVSTNPMLAGQPVMRLNLPDPPPSDIKLMALSSSDLVNWTTNAMRSGTNAWQWMATGPSLIAPGLDTNGRALFDIGTPDWTNTDGQFQCLQVMTN